MGDRGLNQQQWEAVSTTRGRLLVLAGAGSGKTRVIAHRIAHLVEQGTAPEAILGLTFTNKAAAEMRSRVEGLIGKRASGVTLATFHSFCMQVLRKEIPLLGYTKEFSLYDERDLSRLVQQIARDLLGHEGELPSLAPTLAAIEQATQQGEPGGGGQWHDQFAKQVYDRLQATLRAHNAVSFDSLITLTVRLFSEYPSVLSRYQERYRYLLIDEYQDTNPSQFFLAELLASKEHNLCVVGDDDQSIYGWRGAKVENILNFRADKVVKLEQNYRSTSTILAAANGVIRHNTGRHPKQLWSQEASGDPIEVFNAATDQEEAEAIVSRLIQWREAGYAWRDLAILYRSNALARPLELALLNASWNDQGKWIRGIPYEVFGGLEFSERSEIKDLFAYLRVIANPLDQEALLRIINVPRRGISDGFLDKLTQENRRLGRPLWELLEEVAEGKRKDDAHPRGTAGVSRFVDLIHTARRRFAAPPLADSLRWLLEAIDYKKAIAEEVKSEKMRAFKWENAEECVNALAQYETEEAEPALHHFVSTCALARTLPSQAERRRSGEDRVQLMTLHSAKGLEFPICFIAGLEDHLLPHEKGAAETGIEEERRLFYVGITRAREKLILSMARTRLKAGKPVPTTPSRFLFEIPQHLLKPVSVKR